MTFGRSTASKYLARRVEIESRTEIDAGLQKAAGYTESHAQDSGLTEVVACWPKLNSLLKAAVLALAPYLDEQAYRNNERVDTEAGRFVNAVKSVAGKRLTYRQLTDNGGPGSIVVCK